MEATMNRIFFCVLLSALMGPVSMLPATLDEYVERARKLNEFPVQQESLNWTDPDYSAHIRAQEPGIIRLLLTNLGVIRDNTESHKLVTLKADLIEATKRQPDIKTDVPPRPIIQKIVAKKDDRFVVFGDLYGTYHSFVRDLQELERLHVITRDLVIRDKKSYIVLLGNIINRGPYSFELLGLVLALMHKNPARIIYLRGQHETDGFWKSFFAMRAPLKRWELLWGSGDLQKTPLETELNNFFDTLPDILCIESGIKNGIKNNIERFYCCHELIQRTLLQENPAEALFLGNSEKRTLGAAAGLLFDGFTMGAGEWSLLSSPNQVCQHFLGMTHDSFCIVKIGETLRNSPLSHFTHAVGSDKPFTSSDYHASLGYRLDATHPLIPVGVIPLYSSLCLSGPSRPLGFGVIHGIMAACLDINNAGGINGRFLRPIIYDDAYDPTRAAQNIELFLHQQPDVGIIVPIGSPTLAEYIDRVKTGEVKVFFPVTGAPQFRNPDIEGIVHARQAYPYEARCLIKHIVNNYRSRRFAIVYQDDAFGQPLFQASVEELKKLGLKDWLAIPFSRDQINFKEEAQKLEQAKPDAVGIFFASSTLAQNLLTTLSATFPMGKHLFTTSFLADETFKQFLKSRGIDLTFSYTMPDPYNTKIPLLHNYRQAMSNAHYGYDSNSLEGYIATMLMADAIRHLEPPFTGTKYLDYFRTRKNHAFEGLTLSYDRNGLGFNLPIWIKSEKGTWNRCPGGTDQ